jgi:hypothetical protein
MTLPARIEWPFAEANEGLGEDIHATHAFGA